MVKKVDFLNVINFLVNTEPETNRTGPMLKKLLLILRIFKISQNIFRTHFREDIDLCFKMQQTRNLYLN